MPEWQVDIKIKRTYKRYLDRADLLRTIKHVLTSQKAFYQLEVGLLITNDEDVHRLNKRYRKINRTTDVLAFALKEEKKAEENNSASPPIFITPEDGIYRLGEVIISFPQALRQAEEINHPIEDEITRLIVHGFLHLFGYDDIEATDRRRMKAREKRIILKLAELKNNPGNS
ncbi:MAG: rRNA maturation RNase YbeY [Dehalococcoidia bacterium]|nr:rRNA maturation RNase YbeY [Dehalococcoidia bacterium]